MFKALQDPSREFIQEEDVKYSKFGPHKVVNQYKLKQNILSIDHTKEDEIFSIEYTIYDNDITTDDDTTDKADDDDAAVRHVESRHPIQFKVNVFSHYLKYFITFK